MYLIQQLYEDYQLKTNFSQKTAEKYESIVSLIQQNEYKWLGSVDSAIERFFMCVTNKLEYNTIKAYRTADVNFKKWLKETGLNYLTIKPRDIDNLTYWLVKVKVNNETRLIGVGAVAVNTTLSFIRKFYEFLLYNDIPVKNPIIQDFHRLKVKSGKWRRQKGPRGEMLCKAIDDLISHVDDLRDKVLFLILKASGGRINSILSADENNLVIGDRFDPVAQKVILYGTLNVYDDKPDEDMTIYINSEASIAYLQYLNEQTVKKGPLFKNRYGKRISLRGVEKRLARWCEKLRLPKLRPHDFRRAFAHRMKKLNVKIELIAKMMHHKKVTTTMIYLEE